MTTPDVAAHAAELFMRARHPKWTPESAGAGFSWSEIVEAVQVAVSEARDSERQRIFELLSDAECRRIAGLLDGDADDVDEDASRPQT